MLGRINFASAKNEWALDNFRKLKGLNKLHLRKTILSQFLFEEDT